MAGRRSNGEGAWPGTWPASPGGQRATRKEGRTLTPEQAHVFLESLHGHRNKALCAFMLATGLRPGEALGLR